MTTNSLLFIYLKEEKRKSIENGAGDGGRRESTGGEKSNDLFSVHDFDIKIDLDVPTSGKFSCCSLQLIQARTMIL